MNAQEERCEVCRFWKSHKEGDVRDCRKNPPIPFFFVNGLFSHFRDEPKPTPS